MADKVPEIDQYPSDKIEVNWDGRLCLHAGECTRAGQEMFVGKREPWCDPGKVAPDAAAEIVRRCPTGALSYVRKDGGPAEQAEPRNTVLVSARGPLFFRGNLNLASGPDTMPGIRFRLALCRCGASNRKPFCDNSHLRVKFADNGAVGESGEPLAAEGGVLDIRPQLNGPLYVKGNLSMMAGNGRQAWQGTEAWLCRCGQSKNKPFCDSSHKAAGFTAEGTED